MICPICPNSETKQSTTRALGVTSQPFWLDASFYSSLLLCNTVLKTRLTKWIIHTRTIFHCPYSYLIQTVPSSYLYYLQKQKHISTQGLTSEFPQLPFSFFLSFFSFFLSFSGIQIKMTSELPSTCIRFEITFKNVQME